MKLHSRRRGHCLLLLLLLLLGNGDSWRPVNVVEEQPSTSGPVFCQPSKCRSLANGFSVQRSWCTRYPLFRVTEAPLPDRVVIIYRLVVSPRSSMFLPHSCRGAASSNADPFCASSQMAGSETSCAARCWALTASTSAVPIRTGPTWNRLEWDWAFWT
ncbi:hypothetical protein LY78DRAFT_654964 [Colletotrichum sublineola]|nr:hypothetical protein LY78DRAFT_654964 [Colletotrichum sublineola]